MAHEHHQPPRHEGAAAVGHGSPADEYLVTPPGAGYEHTDTNVWIIVKFGLWLAVSAIVIHIGMWFAFGFMVQWREGAEPEFPLAQGQEDRRPDGARLQPIPVNDVFQFRRDEESVLRNYRWIDRQGGRAQIPIAEAMRLTVERGLPARPPQPEPAAEPEQQPARPTLPPGLLPADSSSGRTLERRRQ
jgi:hypothetical protein